MSHPQTPLFSHPIYSDDATLSGGDWETDLPLTNLQHRLPSRVARSTDATTTNTQFDVDLGSSRLIRCVALIRHNLSATAQVRIRGSDNSDMSAPEHDSTLRDAYPDIYPSGVLDTGEPGNDGAPTADDLADERLDVIELPETAVARYWRVEVDDTSNADGYIQIGRLVVAGGWQATRNFRMGLSFGWETSSERVETEGGATHHRERPRRRVWEFGLQHIEEDEAMVRAFGMLRSIGTSTQLYFVSDPTATEHLLRRSYLATLEELPMLTVPHIHTHIDARWRVVEEL